MKRDWGALSSFADWSAVLHELLDTAGQAVQSGDLEKKVAAQAALNQFIMRSPNDICRQLDDIASRAVTDIFNTTVEAAISSIAGRTAELTQHVKTINAVTLEAQKAARSIRLETASNVIRSATTVVRDLADLKRAVKGSAGEQVLAPKLDRAVKAIQDLVPLVMAVGEED